MGLPQLSQLAISGTASGMTETNYGARRVKTSNIQSIGISAFFLR
jgi:hypothetical protein